MACSYKVGVGWGGVLFGPPTRNIAKNLGRKNVTSSEDRFSAFSALRCLDAELRGEFNASASH